VATYFETDESTIDTDVLTDALFAAQETGNLDAFVCAYRAFPPILEALARVKSVDTHGFSSLVHSLDRSLAGLAGIKPPPREPRAGEPLTPREREVLDLVRQGLSNREIGRTLWIAESTVKVHIRHVLEKLGARSRTEAAALSE
jgi:DNA-binding NarL/FixJ family response regulator